ncbi:hypothetical protein EGH56_11830 [Klebsiella aerogenes]|nr:hypothetical protein B9Z99_014680 [Klebsiella aerogenes]RNT33286.1 hypothetical protein B9031_001835 [Klebsiella aerogenes]RSV85592.1 hypothetical protein EGH56_11830 [Klebsiella aerogenes]RSW46854.1 hypothetical protein EGH44_14755 [Klebsiella aerogenes]
MRDILVPHRRPAFDWSNSFLTNLSLTCRLSAARMILGYTLHPSGHSPADLCHHSVDGYPAWANKQVSYAYHATATGSFC